MKKVAVLLWVKWVIVILVLLITSGLLLSEWRQSQVVGHTEYRFNLAMVQKESGITFVSFDPSEKSVVMIPFPGKLTIQARSSGEYSIGSLYKLGEYNGEGGMFARQKLQGFMRVPVPGYIVIETVSENIRRELSLSLIRSLFKQADTSLTKFDIAYLLFRNLTYANRVVTEEELVRAAVLESLSGEANKYRYHGDRLQEYVGTRFFDWGIGAEKVTVSIVNSSGVDGLGSDMADFLTNLGLDVVMVRSGNGGLLEHSSWQVGSEEDSEEYGYIFQNLFGLDEPKVESIPEEFRASVVIRVGSDAKDLF